MTATWDYLAHSIQPTVALIQEADGVPDTPGGSVFDRADDVGYETAVVAYQGRLETLPELRTKYGSKRTFDLKPTVSGTHAVARVVDIPDVDPFVAISFYARIVGP